MQGSLEKKEKRKTWYQYWAILQSPYLKLYPADRKDHLIGWIELNEGARCILGKKSEGKFTFYISVGNRYLFRCDTADTREEWKAAVGM